MKVGGVGEEKVDSNDRSVLGTKSLWQRVIEVFGFGLVSFCGG